MCVSMGVLIRLMTDEASYERRGIDSRLDYGARRQNALLWLPTLYNVTVVVVCCTMCTI